MNNHAKSVDYWEEWLSDITTKEDKRILLEELTSRWKAPQELIGKVAGFCDQLGEANKRSLARELSLSLGD